MSLLYLAWQHGCRLHEQSLRLGGEAAKFANMCVLLILVACRPFLYIQAQIQARPELSAFNCFFRPQAPFQNSHTFKHFFHFVGNAGYDQGGYVRSMTAYFKIRPETLATMCQDAKN